MSAAEPRVVLVTGAGRGIGRAIAEAFAAAGDVVAVNDKEGGLAAKVATSLGPGASAHEADIADVSAVRAMVDAVVQRHGRLDVLVANAGVTRFGDFLDYEPDDFDHLLAVNLRGSYFTAQAAARTMVAQAAPGRIVLLSSVTGLQSMRGLSAYGTSKAGLRMMARTLALELGPHGITVNAVAPGATLTERTLAEAPQYEEAWAAVAPDRRTGHAEDVAHAVLYLCSPAARHVTGHTLVVDGGWTTTGRVPDGY
jgi:glucose 1-dehydrogenase